MNNERMYLKCEICGNVACMIEDAGVKLNCCGQEIACLVPNTREAAVEKHIPVATRDGDKLTVAVGSTIHPMTAEHHIAWVAVA